MEGTQRLFINLHGRLNLLDGLMQQGQKLADQILNSRKGGCNTGIQASDHGAIRTVYWNRNGSDSKFGFLIRDTVTLFANCSDARHEVIDIRNCMGGPFDQIECGEVVPQVLI